MKTAAQVMAENLDSGVTPLLAALRAVHTLPRSAQKRRAWAALMSLAMHERQSVATVGLERLANETGQSRRTLARGFAELEELGLIKRDPLVKKPNSDEWEVRTYRLASRATR